jgi:hypothetical protein
MARKPIPRELFTRESYGDLFKVSENESDLACGLIVAAVLERQLMTLLHSLFIKSGATDDLFKADGGLESYYKCARMAYCLGLISKAAFANLELVGKVRNTLAHSVTVKGFGDPEVTSLCDRLTLPSLKSLLDHPEVASYVTNNPELSAGLAPVLLASDADVLKSFSSVHGRLRFLLVGSMMCLDLASSTATVAQRQTIQ